MGVATVPDEGFWRSPQGTEATYRGRLPHSERADGEGGVLDAKTAILDSLMLVSGFKTAVSESKTLVPEVKMNVLDIFLVPANIAVSASKK